MFGFDGTNDDIPHALSATMSEATIHSVIILALMALHQEAWMKKMVFKILILTFHSLPHLHKINSLQIEVLATFQLAQSIPPVFIKFSDINFAAHKVFHTKYSRMLVIPGLTEKTIFLI